MSEKWIEMIEEPEITTKINHKNLSWTTCNDDQCGIHRSFKKMLNGIQKKNYFFLKKAKYVKQILPNKNTSHGGNDDQNWEIRNTSIDHTKHGNIMSTSFANRMKKYLDNECIEIGKQTIQHVTSE